MTSTVRSKPLTVAPSAHTLLRAILAVCLLLAAALAAIPYLPVDGEHARLITVEENLAALRNAADLYYHQHGHRYPGEYARDGKTPFHRGSEQAAAQAFVAQLTLFTNAAGKVAAQRSAAFPFGPYLKDTRLPANPFVAGESARRIDMDFTLADPDAVYPPDGDSGWRYYLKTGRLAANDSVTLSDGTETAYQ